MNLSQLRSISQADPIRSLFKKLTLPYSLKKCALKHIIQMMFLRRLQWKTWRFVVVTPIEMEDDQLEVVVVAAPVEEMATISYLPAMQSSWSRCYEMLSLL